jgi:hypothetical protein
MGSKNRPPAAHRFVATIYKIGINRCVDVPEDIGRQLGPGAYVPVVAVVAGRTVQTTLVPAGGRGYRLYLNSQVRKAARLDAGDAIGLVLRLDQSSRELPAPPELQAVLQRNAAARRAFAAVTPALRREFLRWVLAAKAPETRTRRVERGVAVIIERAALRGRGKAFKRNPGIRR